MQKKMISLTLALVLAFSMAVSAAAADLRYNNTNTVDLGLSFTGTTANCSLVIRADSGADISAEIMLYKVVNGRNVPVQSWSSTRTTNLTLSGTCGVTSGVKYVLEATATVDGANGVDEIFEETSKVCP